MSYQESHSAWPNVGSRLQATVWGRVGAMSWAGGKGLEIWLVGLRGLLLRSNILAGLDPPVTRVRV